MSTARLCVTVTADTTAELRTRRDAVADADLIELRLDTVRDPDVTGALADRRRPVVLTCRPPWQGGQFRGAEVERHRLLLQARAQGAEYVDVEFESGFTDIIGDGRGIVVSHHDFAGVPADLQDRVRAMRATGAEVVKLAAAASRLTDCLTLAAVAREATGPTVVIGMGDAGLASRVLAARHGSCWSYAGHGAAPGQIPPDRLLGEFRFRHLSSRTAVYGVVGRPVLHSLSPAMHNAAFRAAGIDGVYLPLAAADVDDFFAFADAMGLAGASVTAPFKTDVAARVAGDALTERLGAANTLKRAPQGWRARNTDVSGFLAPLDTEPPLRGQRATILGSGGAARSVAEALVDVGALVTVVGRQTDKAADVAARTGATAAPWPPAAGSWDLLVNATPVGTTPDLDQSPLPGGPFLGALVYDLVYNPPETRLLREARHAGCRTLGGLQMLIAQAAQQFAWWTGRPADVQAMRAAALAALTSSCPLTSS